MMDLIDRWVIPWLACLADWSVRWGLLLIVLAVWFKLRPPRRASIRHLLCAVVLATGVILPFVPRWQAVTVVWPSRAAVKADEPRAHAVVAPPATLAPVPVVSLPTRPGVRLPLAERSSQPMIESARHEPTSASSVSLPQTPPVFPRLGVWRLAALGAVLAWASAVFLLSARLIGGRVLLGRLKQGASAVGADSLQLLDDCRRSLRLVRPARLASHPAVGSPVTLGGRRPVVLVPPDWDRWPESQRRSCLLHELAHLVHRDDWAKLAQELIRVPFFFHPLVSWLLARLDRERELLCDEAVVAMGADPVAYARVLLELAKRPSRLQPGVGSPRPGWLPFIDQRTVAARIERLLEDEMPHALTPLSARRLFGFGAAALAACLGLGSLRVRAVEPGTEAAAPPKAKSPSEGEGKKAKVSESAVSAKAAKETDGKAAPRKLALKIVDAVTGDPMKGVAVKAQIDRAHQNAKTDAEGRLAIAIQPAAPEYVMVSATADGYVPTQVTWRREESTLTLPAEYTLRLEKGTTIGGIITDEQGNAVKGATVYVLVPGVNRSGEPKTNIWDYPALTDDEGRWHCDVVPNALDDVWLRLNHPDYISDTMYGETHKPALPQLRDQSGVMIMKKGLTVSGDVVDAESGKPIAGAEVAQGRDRFGSHYPDTRTAKEGTFAFRNVKPGEIVLTVRAKGHAPDLKTLAVAAGHKPVEFRLKQGQTIRGRLVDSAGKPVAGAFVAADTWRGFRSLMWRVDSDKDGRFRWDEAPDDAVLIDIGKQGFMTMRHQSLKASDEESTITLPAPLRIKGTVVDAKSGKPLDAFTVVPGINWSNGQEPTWERGEARSGSGGRYEISFTEPYPLHVLRIEAVGYHPLDSRSFKSDEGEQTFNARLEKGHELTGVVRLPDGTALESADVFMIPSKEPVFLENGRPPDRRNYPVAKTDGKGQFQFPPQEGAFNLLVFHDRGYARVTSNMLEKGGDVVAQPWGKVEGTIRVGSRPGAGEPVVLNLMPEQATAEGMIYFTQNITADSVGRFVFDRVPPGKVTVARSIKLNERMISSTHGTTVVVEPKGTVRVTIGGTGRPVVGRLVAPEGMADTPNLSLGSNTLHPKVKEPTPPADLSPEKKAAWIAGWMKSDEGKAYLRAMQRTYAVRVEPDGSFRIDDIPAGVYALSLQVHAPVATEKGAFGDLIGTAKKEFRIDEMPDGRSDEPLDIGTLELTLVTRIEVGQAAPTFAAKTIDGKPLALDDFKGKYVLLDFWATWCGPCKGETPNLKAVFEEFGKDDRFAMVGLNLDAKTDEPSAYAKEHNLGWAQGFLGDWSSTNVPELFGVRGIPSIWLIDPEGKVVAKDLRGDKIKAAVAEALSHKK